MSPNPDETGRSVFTRATALFVTVVAVSLSLFQLYTAGLGALTALKQRFVHLGLILALVFMLYPPFKYVSKNRFNPAFAFDFILVLAGLSVGGYLFFGLEEIYLRQGDWTPMDEFMSILAVLLVLEACRRVIGLFMTCTCLAFLAYGYFGPYMPEILAHKGYSVHRIVTQLYLTTEGLFGVPIGVAATFVFIFILFGSFLDKTGGGTFFINMATALAGRFRGGPAKTAVIASGFMGSVSGSAVANVVTTGSFTIPMMKKIGYRPHVAGAIEAAASTGGQLMPPIMGAGAFLMAEFTNTSYLEIIKVAVIPAVMYYLTVIVFVHIAAVKGGLQGQPKETLPPIWPTVKQGIHFILSIVVLIYVLMANYSPMMAGFVAVVSLFLASMLRKHSRLTPGRLLNALEMGARNAVMVSVACGAAGIILGIVGLTGMGLKFASLVVSLSGGVRIFAILLIGLASLVLGMGLPVTASYIVLVILAGPALTDMGVPLIVAHMIVFWYSQDANVTPPVALASFAGAGIAGANPMRTAFSSWKIAKGLYIIPIVMAYNPLLLNGPFFDVLRTVISSTFGLICFAVFLERYLFRRLTWLEMVALGAATPCLFWNGFLQNALGMILFLTTAVYQKAVKRPVS